MNTVRRVLSRLYFAGRGAAAHSNSPPAHTMSAEITYGELNKQIADGPVQIFDVRTPEEVEKGKIPDAVNIPVTAFQEAFKMDPETFAKTFKVNKPKLDDNFVVHCYMGKRGAQAADIATGMGYAHVRNLLGGYKEWAEKEGIPSEGVGHF
uniref:Rhodanese domain-containing protein n=1 Tax=Leptobrachium leishanense TaxID=445787 RepID=A0A8C5WMK5_9ANUR